MPKYNQNTTKFIGFLLLIAPSERAPITLIMYHMREGTAQRGKDRRGNTWKCFETLGNIIGTNSSKHTRKPNY